MPSKYSNSPVPYGLSVLSYFLLLCSLRHQEHVLETANTLFVFSSDHMICIDGTLFSVNVW